ncbi:hypothetical protein M885DRAFT_551168 [Pelagophyceae sp. CCMP2097]|nr:hypothetical protein M885DRAFT_551168 [Pelagophyceae sp. CCMP2097]
MAVSDARAVYAGYIILLLLSLPRHLWYITNADDATISGDTGSFALASLAGVTVDFFDEALWSAFAALARGDARLSSRLGSAFERKDHLPRLGKNGRGRCKLKWMRVGGGSSEGGSWEPADQLTAAHPVRARLLRSLYKARARLADRQIRRLADRQIRRRAGAVLQNAFFAADALRLRALYTARDTRLADTAAAPTAALQQPDDRQAEAYNAVLSNTLKRKRVSGAKAAEYHKVFQPSLGTPPP